LTNNFRKGAVVEYCSLHIIGFTIFLRKGTVMTKRRRRGLFSNAASPASHTRVRRLFFEPLKHRVMLAADLELGWAVPTDVEDGYAVDLRLRATSRDGQSNDVIIEADLPPGLALGAPAMDAGWKVVDGRLRNAIGDVPDGHTASVYLPLHGVGLVEDELVDLLAHAVVDGEDTNPDNNEAAAQMLVWSGRRHDTNGDNVIAPLDALQVINELNTFGSHNVPTTPRNPLDVSGDGVIAPMDVLLIINSLNLYGSRTLPTPIPADDPEPLAYTVEVAHQRVNQNVGERVQTDVHLGTARFVHSETDPLAVDAAFTIGWANVTYPPPDGSNMEPTFITETEVVEVTTGNSIGVELVGDTEFVSNVRIEQSYVAHLGTISTGAEYNVLIDFSAGAYRGDEINLAFGSVQFDTVEVVENPPPQVQPPQPPQPPTPPANAFVITDDMPFETVVEPGEIAIRALNAQGYSTPVDSTVTEIIIGTDPNVAGDLTNVFAAMIWADDGNGGAVQMSNAVQPANGVLTFGFPDNGNFIFDADPLDWWVEVDIMAEPMAMGVPFRLTVESVTALDENLLTSVIDVDLSGLTTKIIVDD